jgi:Leucine-rich repeat (LRR) protein
VSEVGHIWQKTLEESDDQSPKNPSAQKSIKVIVPEQLVEQHKITRQKISSKNMSLEELKNYIHNYQGSLKALNLFQFNLMPKQLLSFLTPCPQLISLKVLNMSDEHMKIISQCCPLLQKLKLKRGPSCVKELTYRGFTMIGRLPNLRKLKLASIGKINTLDLRAIGHSKKLEELDLSQCKELPKEGFRVGIANLKNLKRLNLSGWALLTDDELNSIQGLTELLKLDLSYCPDLSDQTLIEIAKLKKLSHLNLAGCMSITDDGLKHIQGLTELVHLVLENCPQITEKGFEVIRKFPNLKFLNFEEWPEASNQ